LNAERAPSLYPKTQPERMINSQLFIRKGEGENYNYAQDHCFIKLSSRHTNGELCVVEDTIKPGFHLKRHHHKIMTEVFYMLVGELELIFDDETITLREGDTITVPPNVWHEAKSVDGGKMLTLFKNGEFDIFLEQLSTMNENDFSNKEFMSAFSAKFDIYEE
jgi:quercetin dioxygenase-like cupin family protein